MMLRQCRECGAVIPASQNFCAQHMGDTSWGGGRDRAEQAAFRRRLIERNGLRCVRCGKTGIPLQAHHDTPTDGRMLCRPCHRAVDRHAR